MIASFRIKLAIPMETTEIEAIQMAKYLELSS